MKSQDYKIKMKKRKKREKKNINKKNYFINISWDDIFLNNSNIFSKRYHSLIIENKKIRTDFNPNMYNKTKIYNLSNEYDDDIIIDTFQQKIIEMECEKNNRPEVILQKMAKKCQAEYKEDEKMAEYYESLFNKFEKELKESKEPNNNELIDIILFGINFKITKKAQKNFHQKFMNYVKIENKKKRAEASLMLRLGELLNKFSKNKDEIQNKLDNKSDKNNKKIKNQEIKKNELLFLKPKKINPIPLSQKIIEKKEENDFQNNYVLGMKIDSVKEVQKKKEEILLRLKHDIKYKIKEGILSKSEMDNFLDFQKKFNELQLNEINNRIYLNQLEQGITAFEEELKINEEQKKNERRINAFVDSMNCDLHRRYEIQQFLEKTFSHAIDFKKTNYLNKLSPVRTKVIK